MAKGSTCSVEGCERPMLARTWCSMHYARWRAHGDVRIGTPAKTAPLLERFLARVEKATTPPPYRPDLGPCWLWTGPRTPLGYGYLGKRWAHRIGYELFVGPIPDGLELDHLCRYPPCCNPGHLEPVTHAENLRRGVKAGFAGENAAKSHCPKGHPYEGGNLITERTTGRRRCRICTRATQRRWKAARSIAR